MLPRILPIVLGLLLIAGPARAAGDCIYHGSDDQRPATLARGINLSQWWQDGHPDDFNSDDFDALRELGFDFVRLPVSPKWPESDDEDERGANMQELRCDIIALLNKKLTVILDLHAPRSFQKELAAAPDEAAATLEMLWQRMLPVVEDLPPGRVLIGLYNEPDMKAETWWRIQGDVVEALRPVFPQNTFVVEAGPDGGPWNLENAAPYDDRNIIYDFHYYQPLALTHHGADWMPDYDPKTRDEAIAYPVTPDLHAGNGSEAFKDYVAYGWNRAKLEAAIDKAAAWSQRMHVRIACLEFGVYRPYLDKGSRFNWLRDMREILEQNGIPWALWEYRGGFGLLDADDEPDEPMANALGLGHSREP